MNSECSAYERNGRICRNGFIQTHFCWFGGSKCSGCGQDSRSLPHCLKDELPDHWVKDDGSPFFHSAEGKAS